MELSVQNSNFLSFLNKLDIDVKQFPEKTFDGLFENVPEPSNYFFNWFMENITPDNALTQSEQATYFQLANGQSLCTEEEVNYVLSSSSPTFEQLMSLDVNYVNNSLSEDLKDLEKTFIELSKIKDSLECSHNEVKKKQNNLKEIINARKKYLNTVKKDCHEINSSFGSKVEEIKLFLLEEQNLALDFDIFYDSLPKEETILKELESSKLLENDAFRLSKINALNVLEENLECAEISMVLSEGFLRLKKVKRDFLLNLIQKKSSQKNYNNHSLILSNTEGVDDIVSEEIKVLENELFEKLKILSEYEVKKISDENLLSKISLITSYIKELASFKDFMKSSFKINKCLLHILQKSTESLENVSDLRKQLYFKLNELDTGFNNSITNLELRKQRFQEVTFHQDQHPVLTAVKNVMKLEENPQNNEEALKKVVEFMSHVNEDSNFITHGFRSDLQIAIKSLCDTTLCGPTSQLLYVPVELLVKLQDCEQWENKLSQMIKQVVNKYVDAKVTVSKSDRKMFLLWIDFLTNPLAFLTKVNQQPQSRNR